MSKGAEGTLEHGFPAAAGRQLRSDATRSPAIV
jgi:hypothetical protein